jgi:hypothetical protein
VSALHTGSEADFGAASGAEEYERAGGPVVFEACHVLAVLAPGGDAHVVCRHGVADLVPQDDDLDDADESEAVGGKRAVKSSGSDGPADSGARDEDDRSGAPSPGTVTLTSPLSVLGALRVPSRSSEPDRDQDFPVAAPDLVGDHQ